MLIGIKLNCKKIICKTVFKQIIICVFILHSFNSLAAENSRASDNARVGDHRSKGESKYQGRKPGRIFKEHSTGMEFLWIPGDCFRMGNLNSDRLYIQHEKPTHKVCLDGFWMGKFEVTNTQFRKFRPSHDRRVDIDDSMNRDHHPVVEVSWVDAKHFASWLTEQSTKKYLYRLPTEAEWEYACRVKTSTARFWGDNPDEACGYANIADRTRANETTDFHHCDDGFLKTSPAGSFNPNDFGLYDMLGNVWEWGEDNYGKNAYRFHKKQGRKNPIYKQIESNIDFKVIRGGSWQSGPDSTRCANRKYNPKNSKHDVLGFRLVMVPLPDQN